MKDETIKEMAREAMLETVQKVLGLHPDQPPEPPGRTSQLYYVSRKRKVFEDVQ